MTKMEQLQRERAHYILEKSLHEKQNRSRADALAYMYGESFDAAYEQREIRRASERAHWLNLIIPALRGGNGLPGMVPWTQGERDL